MTPEQRETLAQELERVQLALRAFPNAIGHHELAVALRAALVERTCGTCAHFDRLGPSAHGLCAYFSDNRDPDDGCLKGWTPRQTETP